MMIIQTKMITGMKQQKTINPAAIHLNMIFRREPKGMSKSTTATRCAANVALGIGGIWTCRGVGGGNWVPYFSIGKCSSIAFQSRPVASLHGVSRFTRWSANNCATCDSEQGPSSRPESLKKYDFWGFGELTLHQRLAGAGRICSNKALRLPSNQPMQLDRFKRCERSRVATNLQRLDIAHQAADISSRFARSSGTAASIVQQD